MVLTPVRSRVRATAAVSGGAAIVCLACAGFTAVPAATMSPAESGQSVRLVTQVAFSPTPATVAAAHGVPAASGIGGGPGGGSGGGSDGSAGNAVAPSPARHTSNSSSSSSGGSTGSHAASSEGPGLLAGIFKHVGHWLGLSGDDSKTSSDSKPPSDPAPKPAKPAGASSSGSGSDGGSGGPAGGTSGDPSLASDIVHSVFAGLGRFFNGLFGG